MSVLLLRIASPLQSWGIDAKFDRRGTHPMPTKSAIIGMVASAMGKRRDESIEDLHHLRFGVRVEKPGQMLRDYHTAKSKKSAYVTHRYYLADAVFLIGLEGEAKLLNDVNQAILNPYYPLFLGRRSCPPEGRVSLGIHGDKTLENALREHEWLVSPWVRQKEDVQVRLPIFIESSSEPTRGVFLKDHPVSFDQQHRKFGYRRVMEIEPKWMSNEHSLKKQTENTTHDATQAFKEG